MNRRGLLVGGIVVAVLVAAAGVVVVAAGGGTDGGLRIGERVVLEPAAAVPAGAFFDDFDLYPVAERVLAESAGATTFDAFAELDEPVALAGRVVRAFEPGAFSGTHDRPPCDVEALETLLDDEPDSASVSMWFTVLDQPENQRHDYVADLTPIRLRFDTRVTSHRLEEGEAVAYQSLLQAGTAVLVDQRGTPQVRCAGGNPLDDPEPAPDLDGDAALDLDQLAQNPEDAWDGLDPALTVVIDSSASQEHFDLADPADGTLFRRHEGSDGTRDQTLESEEDRPDRCAEGCHTLEITMEAVSGSRATLQYDDDGEPMITTTGSQPTGRTPFEVSWTAGAAARGTYGVTVTHEYLPLRELTDDEVDAIQDVPGFLETLLDNPELDNETVELEIAPTVNGRVVPARLLQCVPGDITVTFTVDGEVAEAITQAVACDESRTFEHTIE